MQLKDSISGELKLVTPDSHSGVVSIYACGITPYSPAHVGHARTYVVYDLMARALRAQGHSVRLVRNITDIDDKIIAAAKKENIQWFELSGKYAAQNRGLMQAMGLAVPEEPAASEYLDEIFWLIDQLRAKDLAYLATNGDVLYRVGAYSGSALLMPHQEGALRSEQGHTRVDAEHKEDPRDFALWKRVPASEPGFESPFGWGRPGWHIECSAMIYALFGGSVTIHGGGMDLKFPHHQAEIMQSEPVFERPLADIWTHNGSVLSAGRKMSKSEGNFVTWQSALDLADAQVPGLGGQLLAYTLLQAQWGAPLDWNADRLEAERETLFTLTEGLADVVPAEPEGLIAVLDHNLDTAAARAWLWSLHKQGRKAELAGALKFLGVDPGQWARQPRRKVTLTPEAIADLQERRHAARLARDWGLSDSLRDELVAHGVEVQDRPLR